MILRGYIIQKYLKIFRWILNYGCNCGSDGNIASFAKLFHRRNPHHGDSAYSTLRDDRLGQSRIGILRNKELFDVSGAQSLAKLLQSDHLSVGFQLFQHGFMTPPACAHAIWNYSILNEKCQSFLMLLTKNFFQFFPFSSVESDISSRNCAAMGQEAAYAQLGKSQSA